MSFSNVHFSVKKYNYVKNEIIYKPPNNISKTFTIEDRF